MERLRIDLPPTQANEKTQEERLTCRTTYLAEHEKKKAEQLNREPGNLTGYDCPKCLNRGCYYRVDGQGRRYVELCHCMEIRKSLKLIEQSGLSSLMERYTFDTWEVTTSWQKRVLNKAKEYVKGPNGNWFMMSGRPGSGKTHICTALCGEFLRQGIGVRYILWRDVSIRAKGAINDQEEYEHIVAPLKNIPVLYIDDLLKVGRGDAPSNADMGLAFEILNARYNEPKRLTIISSERDLNEITQLDEATGSRIYERTKGFYFNLYKVNADNWRLLAID